MNDDKKAFQHSTEQQDRQVDLLIQRATTGLSEPEQQELDQLASPSENRQEFERFEAAAAAFDLSITSVDYQAMPTLVHDRLLVSAGRFFGEHPRDEHPLVERPVRDDSGTLPPESKVELSNRKNLSSSVRWREILATAVAAASLLMLLSGFNPFSRNDAAPVASVVEQMNQFIESAPSDLVDVDWQPVHSQSAGGKVIWSDTRQEGYMVFNGMDINDPSVEQYQLWIFDNDTGQATPTDGGVFNISKSDIGPNGNVVIPIKSTVPVNRAVQFAVTVEKPGGVYVSERQKIPVLAKIDGVE